jgi:integrase
MKGSSKVAPRDAGTSGGLAREEGPPMQANDSTAGARKPAPPPLVKVDGKPGIYSRDRKGKRTPSCVVVYNDETGKQRRKTLPNLRAAEAFQGRVKGGERQAESRLTFSTYADGWIESYTGRTARGVSDGTRESYRESLKLAKDRFGNTRLTAVTASRLKAYIKHLADEGLAPSSVRRYYAPVKALLATAYEDGLIRSNPAQGVRVIVADTRPSKPKHLTAEQTRVLLAKMPEEYSDLVFLLARTGLRISEALGAMWGDIGQDSGGRIVLRVRRDTTKTDAGERAVPLTPETLGRPTRRRTEAGWNRDSDPIFPTATGTFMDSHNFRSRVFNKAREDAGLSWATPHKLRHGVGTLMNAHGCTPADVAAMLGHADGGVLAMRTYVHAEAPSVDFLDEALREPEADVS